MPVYILSKLWEYLTDHQTLLSGLLCKSNRSSVWRANDCTHLGNNTRFPCGKTFAIICYFVNCKADEIKSTYFFLLFLLLVSCSWIDKMQMDQSLMSTAYESLRQFRTLSNPEPITLCDWCTILSDCSWSY